MLSLLYDRVSWDDFPEMNLAELEWDSESTGLRERYPQGFSM